MDNKTKYFNLFLFNQKTNMVVVSDEMCDVK